MGVKVDGWMGVWREGGEKMKLQVLKYYFTHSLGDISLKKYQFWNT